MNCAALCNQVIDRRDDRVVAHRLGNSLGVNGRPFCGEDLVLNQGVGVMTEENAAKLSVRLQPGSQVYLAANDRVVHAVLTAKVADSAIARINADT